MHPFLVNRKIGPIPLRIATYGVFVFLSILVTGALFILLSKDGRKKLVAHLIFLIAVLVMTAIGSKVIQFLLDLYMHRGEGLSAWQLFLNAGSTITGGAVFALAGIFIYGRIDPHRVVTWQSIDSLAAAFPVGHMFGRFGCYFGGCCYGDICSTWAWTITYPENWVINLIHEQPIPHGPRYPSPLLEASALLFIGVVLIILLRTLKNRGQVIALYFMLYGAARFTVEFTRGDSENRGYIGELSTFQYLSVLLFLIGIGLLILFFIRKKRGLTGPPYLPINGKEPREKDALDS